MREGVCSGALITGTWAIFMYVSNVDCSSILHRVIIIRFQLSAVGAILSTWRKISHSWTFQLSLVHRNKQHISWTSTRTLHFAITSQTHVTWARIIPKVHDPSRQLMRHSSCAQNGKSATPTYGDYLKADTLQNFKKRGSGYKSGTRKRFKYGHCLARRLRSSLYCLLYSHSLSLYSTFDRVLTQRSAFVALLTFLFTSIAIVIIIIISSK